MNQAKIFDILPDNFFSILSSERHKVYADCIFLLYNFLGNGTSFGENKEELVLVLTEYYNHYANDDDKTMNSREKALHTLRRLKQCGWIFEEDEANYQVLVNFTYYAIPVIKTLYELRENKQLEYLGYIFIIYSAVKNIQKDNLSDLIDQIHHNTSVVICKLKTLNSNIKRYIQNLLNKKSHNDLKCIVEDLFIDYKKNIIDDSYHRLKTSDNVSKYRPYIVSKLNDLCINEILINEVCHNLVIEEKYDDIESAKMAIYTKIEEIILSFQNMDLIIGEIDKKNTKYIQMSIAKIMFIVNNTKDLQGKIYSILRHVASHKEKKQITELFSIHSSKQITCHSIYTMPQKCKVALLKIHPPKYLNEVERGIRVNKLMQDRDYSKKSINEFILKQLKNSNKLKASEMPIQKNIDYIRLILVYMYSKSSNMNYKIKKLSQGVTLKQYQFSDFEISRK